MTVEAFAIRVRPSPETNDHEVCLMADGEDLVARLGSALMGLDPDDLLVEPCPLAVDGTPRTVTVGRCECGVTGCDSVAVVISREGEVVTWSSTDGATRVRFDARQYSAEVARALGDFSWETQDRTAARLIARGMDRQALAAMGLRFIWASGRVEPRQMTVSLDLDGAYQVLVHVPWDAGRSAEEVAADVLAHFRLPPQHWGRVIWYPQRQAIGVPALAGPGWAQRGR
jgi:hypothetical protein